MSRRTTQRPMQHVLSLLHQQSLTKAFHALVMCRQYCYSITGELGEKEL